MQLKDITYRHVAKMIASALPVEGQEFGLKVEQYLKVIMAMPTEQKNALKFAYIFSRKVPREEREDMFQDIALAIFKAKAKDTKLAYAIARCDWVDFWKRYKIRQHYSLDSVVDDTEGNPTTLAELIVGETEFEFKMNGKMDAERIWDKLPALIKPLITKRLSGKGLNNTERSQLNRYIKVEGYKLLIA